MFSYYGTKWKLAKYYPAAKCDTIIEPFAGAAGYSLFGDNWQKKVLLFDANPKIVAVWDYLIKATPAGILKLPDITIGQAITDFTQLSDPEKWLMGFCINPGSTSPKITCSSRGKWAEYKMRIANTVQKVKHWRVQLGSYQTAPDVVATWHIDPPYQTAGKYYYGFSALDFSKLGTWCKTRRGQVMVCENMGADWLPFQRLCNHRGSVKSNVEAVWYSGEHHDPLFGLI